MQSIAFIYDYRISHYDYTKQRPDIVTMRGNYSEWVQNNRDEGYKIYYSDDSWEFKAGQHPRYGKMSSKKPPIT